ncbi:MAG: hypothetical protein JWL81_3255 [Verrucomicrobiales bacterium]|nr:hypothetical protein [Verrucomicrobiales bacterium]
MEIHYNTSESITLRLDGLTFDKPLKKNYYYRVWGLPIISTVSGVLCMLFTRYDLYGLWLALISGSFLAKCKFRDRFYNDLFAPKSPEHSLMRETSLTISDKGLTEECAGVSSFAPWSAVTSARLFEEILVISLASGQRAIISGHNLLDPDLTITEIRDEILRQKAAAADALTPSS